MQITSGTISFAVGETTVTASTDADWSQVVTGCWLIHNGQHYTITSAPVSQLDGTKTVTISPAAISTVVNANYVIVRDFTENFGLPLLNPGDLEAAAIFSRAMAILDPLLAVSSGIPSQFLQAINYEPVSIGNAVTYTANGLRKASTAAGLNNVIGVVVAINGNMATVQTHGPVTGIVGVSFTLGGEVYLRTPFQSGDDWVNLTQNVNDAGDNIIPVMIATGGNSGVMIPPSNSRSSAFGLNKTGAVVGPTVVAGNFLADDGTFKPVTVSDNSIAAEKLSTANVTVNWANFSSKVAGTSIWAHIMDLHTRLAAVENTAKAVCSQLFVGATTNPFSFTVPASVYQLRVKVHGPVALRMKGTTNGQFQTVYSVDQEATRLSEGVEFFVKVTPGQQLTGTFDSAKVLVSLDSFGLCKVLCYTSNYSRIVAANPNAKATFTDSVVLTSDSDKIWFVRSFCNTPQELAALQGLNPESYGWNNASSGSSASIENIIAGVVEVEYANPTVDTNTGCFSGDTLVLTDAGWKPICHVNVGDRMMVAYPDGAELYEGIFNPTYSARIAKVEEVFRNTYKEAIVIDGIKTTFEHPIWALTETGWKFVPACRLSVGDIVYCHDDPTLRRSIKTITRVSGEFMTWNLHVEWPNMFIVQGGMLAHNKVAKTPGSIS